MRPTAKTVRDFVEPAVALQFDDAQIEKTIDVAISERFGVVPTTARDERDVCCRVGDILSERIPR